MFSIVHGLCFDVLKVCGSFMLIRVSSPGNQQLHESAKTFKAPRWNYFHNSRRPILQEINKEGVLFY